MASPFLALPAEIKNEIYRYAIEWPDFEIISRRLENQLRTEEPSYEPKLMTTPTLLLLNRRISSDARDMPFELELVIDAPLPFNAHINRSISITDVICKPALQRLRFVKLKLELDFGRVPVANGVECWLELVKDLLEIWDERNAIERLEVVAHYVPPTKIRGWGFGEAAHHQCAMKIICRLKGYRNAPVLFTMWSAREGIRHMKTRHSSKT